MYPSLLDDIAWLRFSTEIKAKLQDRIPGDTDVFRIANGRMLFIVNVNVINEVDGYFVRMETAVKTGPDSVVETFMNYVREARKHRP